MNEQIESLQDLQHIKKMMERSSRFISLSGLSGISAGVCALIGAWFAYPYIYTNRNPFIDLKVGLTLAASEDYRILLDTWLFWIGVFTFIAAFITAFIFTWVRSKKQGIPVWGVTARRVMINVLIPLLAGGLFVFKLALIGSYGLVAPGCLIFYGLALVNTSKYTLKEIRFLGYCESLLGVINLWRIGYGFYFWAIGFGILHVIYGAYMWMKYERTANHEQLGTNE